MVLNITATQAAAGTATASSATTIAAAATTGQQCVDTPDPLMSCADMKSLGYCNPVAGAGYALAQIICPVTCGLCP